MLRSNKDRLYVALYLRGGKATMPGKEDAYHWALLVGPKEESEGSKGFRLHAKDTLNSQGSSTWIFEQRESSMTATSQILVRVVVGKISDRDWLFDTIRSVPLVQNDPAWNCVLWVKGALEAIQHDGKAVGTAVLDWQKVRDFMMEYIQRKKDAGRWDGKATPWPVTYDLLEGKELVSSRGFNIAAHVL